MKRHVTISLLPMMFVASGCFDWDSPSAACVDDASCACSTGFSRTSDGECVDLDECALGTAACDEHAVCTNTEGGFDCTCDRAGGYAGDGVTCSDLDECAQGLDDCDLEPRACVNRSVEAGRFECACPSGYVGTGAGQDGCVDIDECGATASPCDDSPIATCGNDLGTFTCTCPTGFGGDGRGSQGCLPVLSDLRVSAGILEPAFDPLISEYTLRTGPWRLSVGLTPSAPGTFALDSGGETLVSGVMVTRELPPGESRFEIGVSAGGARRAYTIRALRDPKVESLLRSADPGAGDYFGYAVALSADGATLAVGAYGEGGQGDALTETGAAYVFVRTGGRWTLQQVFRSPKARADAHFGRSLALSADGSLLAVGAYKEDEGAFSDCGSIYTYSRVGDAWSTEPVAVKHPFPASKSFFGFSVALSADGTTLVAGVIGYTPNAAEVSQAGTAYLFSRTSDGWTAGYRVAPTSAIDRARFGYAVATNQDGSTVAIAAPQERQGSLSDVGAVYVFERSGSTWGLRVRLASATPDASDRFGISIALSGDGSLLAAGSLGDGGPDNALFNAGAVHVFVRSPATGTQQAAWGGMGEILRASVPATGAAFGLSVALSASGTTLAVGASGADDAGAVHVLVRDAQGWAPRQTLIKAAEPGSGGSTTVGDGDRFGASVSLSSDGAVLAVGAYGEAGVDDTAYESGAVYVY